MHQHGGVEHDRDRQELPEPRVIVDAFGERIHRDVAERVVEEMAEEIGEQDHAADEADLAHADPLDFFPDLLG